MSTLESTTTPVPASTLSADETYRMHRRWDRMGRLVGDAKIKRLMESHVMVIGLGGVGSWAAESLARSAVGTITIVDFDEVCITNFNRQLHATQGKVGQKKSQVMAERLRAINPQAVIRDKSMFFNADYESEIFDVRPDFVIDAIDSVTPKCLLIAKCKREGIPMIVSTGSAGRLDPTQVQIDDLAKTEMDPLARSVRKILRQQHGFPHKGKFGIQAVSSIEEPTMPEELKYDNGQGFKCVCPQGQNEFFNCDNRNLIMGSASFVTGAFGLACAGAAVKHLLSH